MENPATWGEAEHIVSRILDEDYRHRHQVAQGEAEPLCGFSLERRITDALRDAGFLSEDQLPGLP